MDEFKGENVAFVSANFALFSKVCIENSIHRNERSQSLISIFAPKTPHELRFKMAADGEVDKYFSFVCI